MDSYDYAKALSDILPSLASIKLKKGGFLVLRPDSGDQVEAVLMGLRYSSSYFKKSKKKHFLSPFFHCGTAH